jgi:hypothetical protein
LHAPKVNSSNPCRRQAKRVTEGRKRAECTPSGCPARCKRRGCISGGTRLPSLRRAKRSPNR